MIALVKAWLNLAEKFGKKTRDEKVEGKYYTRTGDCTMCGKCCTGIYLVHGRKTIESVAEFERLQTECEDYTHFKPIDVNEDGVIFQCVHLQADNSCGNYENRPLFCRKYPSETSLLLGGKLPSECGYVFTLKKTFGEVLSNTAQQPAGKVDRKAGVLVIS